MICQAWLLRNKIKDFKKGLICSIIITYNDIPFKADLDSEPNLQKKWTLDL